MVLIFHSTPTSLSPLSLPSDFLSDSLNWKWNLCHSVMRCHLFYSSLVFFIILMNDEHSFIIFLILSLVGVVVVIFLWLLLIFNLLFELLKILALSKPHSLFHNCMIICCLYACGCACVCVNMFLIYTHGKLQWGLENENLSHIINVVILHALRNGSHLIFFFCLFFSFNVFFFVGSEFYLCSVLHLNMCDKMAKYFGV